VKYEGISDLCRFVEAYLKVLYYMNLFKNQLSVFSGCATCNLVTNFDGPNIKNKILKEDRKGLTAAFVVFIVFHSRRGARSS
jgi:hypothetical protein